MNEPLTNKMVSDRVARDTVRLPNGLLVYGALDVPVRLLISLGTMAVVTGKKDRTMDTYVPVALTTLAGTTDQIMTPFPDLGFVAGEFGTLIGRLGAADTEIIKGGGQIYFNELIHASFNLPTIQ